MKTHFLFDVALAVTIATTAFGKDYKMTTPTPAGRGFAR